MTARSQLFNKPEDCVDEALHGLVRLSQGALALHPTNKRIVARADWTKDRVALISLGGSGHEPAHAGFVGKGMLTAAVAGNIFASPPPASIVEAIAHVGGDYGVLLIVKNYTGDITNARLAKQRAEKEYGLKIEILICGDDIATMGSEGAGARGLAGTLFLHKILGAFAENGENLENLHRIGTALAEKIRTMGISFNTCALPGQAKPERVLSPGSAELGLGIHGEPGVQHLSVAPSSRQAAEQILNAITTSRNGTKTSHIALLMNNLGGLSTLEMMVFSNDVFNILDSLGISVAFCVMGSLMTSLDSAGVSVSLLFEPSDDELAALKEYTSASGWPTAQSSYPRSSTSLRKSALSSHLVSQPERKEGIKKPKPVAHTPSLTSDLVKGLLKVCEAMQSTDVVHQLNELDTFAGDGDTGNSLKFAFTEFASHLTSRPPQDVLELLDCAKSASERMGGSLGAFLSIFFDGVANLDDEPFEWSKSISRGLRALDSAGAAKKGDRSFLDALRPGVEALGHGLDLAKAAEAARKGANATAQLKARVGRACYIPPDRYIGHNDAGAQAVARLFELLAEHIG